VCNNFWSSTSTAMTFRWSSVTLCYWVNGARWTRKFKNTCSFFTLIENAWQQQRRWLNSIQIVIFDCSFIYFLIFLFFTFHNSRQRCTQWNFIRVIHSQTEFHVCKIFAPHLISVEGDIFLMGGWEYYTKKKQARVAFMRPFWCLFQG
jgi:hypothetical protein